MQVKVGEYYDVLCIVSHGLYYPIIGPEHADGAELCQNPETPLHYHYDYRFMENEGKNEGIISRGREVVVKRLKCVRERCDNGSILWGSVRLYRMFQHHKLDLENPICPHKKFPLVNPDGLCPAHGMVWNMKTGETKFKPPFYIRFKDDPDNGLNKIEDRERYGVKYTGDKKIRAIVEIIDRDQQIVGDCHFKEVNYINHDDTLFITTGCVKQEP